MSASGQKGRALVLGGASGMLGQALSRHLQEEGWEVHSLGRADGSLEDRAFLEERFGRLNPDLLFNAIAYTAVDAAEDNEAEAMRLNRDLPARLGRVLQGSACRLIHYSSDFVFNGRHKQPYIESDAVEPLSAYGRSKLAGERALLELGSDKICVLRTAWLFGPGKKNFVSTMLQLAQERSELTVVHDQVGSPTYTVDLAQMSLKLAEAGASGLFHAVNSGRASWCELASEAVSLSHSLTPVRPINSDQWPQKAHRPRFSQLSCAKLSGLINYQPRSWCQALRDYIFTYHSDPGASQA